MAYFSIVITVHNKENFIHDTLSSVLRQTFEDFEVIIVNDGSTDRSLEILNSFNDKRITIFSQKNKGASASRNLGMEKSTSIYIALLDGDDIWDPSYLNNMYEATIGYPNENVFTCGVAQKYDDKIVPVRYSFNFTDKILILNYFKASKKHTLLTSSSIVFKKSILETTQWFDTTIKSGQDTDMWIRIGLHFQIIFIPKTLVYYVYDNNSLSNTTFDLSSKPKFDNYKTFEKTNKDLKIFLDVNRYSMAVLSKIYNDKKAFRFFKKSIQTSSLSLRHLLLLNSPSWLLKILLKIQSLKGERLYYKPL